MKTAIALLMLVAAAQAVNWSDVKPMRKVRPSILPRAPVNNGRVIGGSLATPGQFPYQVGVYMDDSYFCGGSIIAGDVILTAAHCVDGFRKWEVRAGVINIDDSSAVVSVSRNGIAHENYGSFFIVNDIGLIKLDSAISGSNIATIRLPSRSSVGTDVNGPSTLSGWGKTSDNAPGITRDLNWVTLPIVDNSVCEAIYGGNSVRVTNICVDTTSGVSSCNGDSGGPLTKPESDGVETEIGIVSYGASAGCEVGYPAVFTRVDQFLDWIATNGGVTIRP